MADLVLKFVELGLSIKDKLDKAHHNAEDCRRIGDLLHRLSAMAKHLPKAIVDDLMMDMAEGLQKALQRASDFVAKCEGKWLLSRAYSADDIAQELHGICLDVLLNMTVVLLANSALNSSVLAELKEDLAQLRADITYTNSMLAKILQIIAARPDVDLPEEVEKLVKDYQISSQNKDKREAKKTDVPSSQNKDKREAKITDVPSSQNKDKREANITDVPSSQNKDKREAKKTDVPSSQNKDKNKRPEDSIQKNNKRRGSKVVPHASLPDGLAESASAASVVGQYDDGSCTIINKASSSISKLVDEAQSVGVSAAPFHPQKIISISEEPGETDRYKVYPHSSKTSKLLEVYPQQLIFPLEPKNKGTTRCPVTLTNKTGDYVGIWIKPINGQFTKPEIMEPHSTLVVHAQPPKDTDKFEVLMIIIQSKRDHRKLESSIGKLESSIGGKLNMDSGFMVCVEKLKAEVYRAVLTAITCDPASCQIISRSIENMTLVTSIDAHPTKTWIVTGHEEGIFSIWDYQKQETVELQVKFKKTPPRHSVYPAKFTAEGKWLVVGDSHGYIYVYDCTDTKLHEVKKFREFRAHDNKSVNSLASHPTEPYLLSSSNSGRNIKVWDLSKNCKEIQKFYVKSRSAYLDGVCSVKFNPRDTDTFACVTRDNRVKVGNKKTSIFETTLKGCVEADFFFTHQHLVTLSSKNSHNSEVWDLKTGKVVHTLSVSGCKTTRVACHPKLPILVTTLDDGTVCLWDASTYRLEKMVHITDSECLDLVFLPDTNGLPRLVVAFKTMIAIMEVNLPIANTSNAGINKE